MSVLLLKSDLPQRDQRWLDAFAKERPGLEVRRWPDLGDVRQIDYSLTWQLPHGVLSKLPNLKVIFSIGAGVDHLVRDPEVPRNLPLVRMVEAGLKQGIGEWVLFAVLQQHRDMLDYQAQQQRKIWSDLESYLASERPVGILGLGELGQHCAHLLKAVGFPVTGWSRSPKTVAGIPVLHGPEGLKKILQESRVVVSLLPLTPDTENLMNAERFAMMPRGSAFVNAGRGRQVVEEDLIAALDRGHLAGATLDVTRVEPLPKESPLWTHPRIFLTPHCAAQTIPETAVKAVAENIRRFEEGQPLQHLYDWVRGY